MQKWDNFEIFLLMANVIWKPIPFVFAYVCPHNLFKVRFFSFKIFSFFLSCTFLSIADFLESGPPSAPSPSSSPSPSLESLFTFWNEIFFLIEENSWFFYTRRCLDSHVSRISLSGFQNKISSSKKKGSSNLLPPPPAQQTSSNASSPSPPTSPPATTRQPTICSLNTLQFNCNSLKHKLQEILRFAWYTSCSQLCL